MMAEFRWVRRGSPCKVSIKESEMCLAIPARIEQLIADNSAIVNLGGVRKEISLALLEDVAVGDYVIVHVGYALQKSDEEEALRTLELFAEMKALNDLPDELS